MGDSKIRNRSRTRAARLLKADYSHDRAAIKAELDNSPADRKAPYSLTITWRAMESAKLSDRIRQERQALRAKHWQPGKEGYRVFLAVLARLQRERVS